MTRQIAFEQQAAGLWTATFDNPPINLIDPDTVGELLQVVASMENDEEVKVVVFRSADPDFFLAHWDVAADQAKLAAIPHGPTGLPPWADLLIQLSRAPAISIAEIRGRARGAGSEFILACDMRFASRERAILGQPEVGLGMIPGGNPMARLAGLTGRGRGLEIILGADDFSAEVAELYGYVNRAVRDDEIETFVDSFARRLASFEKHALTGAKALMNDVSLPPDDVFPPALTAFRTSSAHPKTRARAASLFEHGLQQRSETELHLGRELARTNFNQKERTAS
ncbi:enoyl-CoA hydratase/isomerase family protein [Tardiphaga sp. P9-11]|jgi:enoyl-CoA hydratase/carnithine racemase|uniref:enoyl-CoA hydratase/isomerase family protein n=1 Tax=Tardiphaga sp. P9-11 TaxID=2024614 RepID=UPI0011F208DC|nr:enoyl-CoA hydratase/isomerase family protein [Tardiphaga sp. P9-11]KAA0070529.1 enoyl-CoA hydratase/isomerase family protein [Tardiphaga sp. P9-11]